MTRKLNSSPESSLETDSTVGGKKYFAEEIPASIKDSSRGKIDFFTLELVGVFDRWQTSDRDIVRITAAVAKALGHKIEELILNWSSIKSRRSEFCRKQYEEIKGKYNLEEYSAVVLHWDGKLLWSMQNRKIDRLAVLITFNGVEQLLDMPEIQSSKGDEQASAVHHAS